MQTIGVILISGLEANRFDNSKAYIEIIWNLSQYPLGISAQAQSWSGSVVQTLEGAGRQARGDQLVSFRENRTTVLLSSACWSKSQPVAFLFFSDR